MALLAVGQVYWPTNLVSYVDYVDMLSFMLDFCCSLHVCVRRMHFLPVSPLLGKYQLKPLGTISFIPLLSLYVMGTL